MIPAEACTDNGLIVGGRDAHVAFCRQSAPRASRLQQESPASRLPTPIGGRLLPMDGQIRTCRPRWEQGGQACSHSSSTIRPMNRREFLIHTGTATAGCMLGGALRSRAQTCLLYTSDAADEE